MSNTLTLNFIDAGMRGGTQQYSAVGIPGLMFIPVASIASFLPGTTINPFVNITIGIKPFAGTIGMTIGGKSVENTNVYAYAAPNITLMIPSWLLWRTLDSKPRRPYNIYVSLAGGTSEDALQQNPIGPNITTPGPQQIGGDLDL